MKAISCNLNVLFYFFLPTFAIQAAENTLTAELEIMQAFDKCENGGIIKAREAEFTLNGSNLVVKNIEPN